ncbi:MAG TPA: c-type cytochrome [Gemmatimonadaceae bacterium]|nr:c-type cytochrome [Gemmatimonadaceae bacterium]
MTRRLRRLSLAGALLAAACGGGGEGDVEAPSETAAGATSVAADSASPAGITADMVALGNELYHGRQANAICYTCHGMDATGGPGNLGPNLTDAQWLHSDGSYGGILGTIRAGVAQPVQAPGPMPPMGGAALTEEQLRAVAAYVYSLTHPEVPQADVR